MFQGTKIKYKIKTCRVFLKAMICLAFMINFMLRANIVIASLEMIKRPNSTLPEWVQTFEWDEKQRNHIFGMFYIGAIIVQIPAGRLAEIYGTKIVLGIGTLLASVVTLGVPFYSGKYYVLLVSRILVGILLGGLRATVPPMAIKWSNPNDRSSFLAYTSGATVGLALTSPLCGLLVAKWHWPSVFYVTGAIGILWSLVWMLFVSDSPRKHHLCAIEMEKITAKPSECVTLKDEQIKKSKKIPWLKLLRSKPLWAFAVIRMAGTYFFVVLSVQVPTLLQRIYKVDIVWNSIMYSFINIVYFISGITTPLLAERILKRKLLSLNQVRKIFTAIAFIVPGVIFICLGLIESTSIPIVVTLLSIKMLFSGFESAGYVSNSMDIAPNFSGTLFGISGVLSSASSFASTTITGMILHHDSTQYGWQLTFYVTSGVVFFGCFVFIVFGSVKIQKWN